MCWYAGVLIICLGWPCLSFNSLVVQDEEVEKAPEVPTILFSNINPSDVRRNPTARTRLNVAQAIFVTRVLTCHWPVDNQVADGEVSIEREDGTVVGSWRAVGQLVGLETTGRLWAAEPNVVLPPGQYFLIDSRRETWVWNAESGGSGIAQVWGVPQHLGGDTEDSAPPAEGMQRFILDGLQIDSLPAWQADKGPSSGRIRKLRLGTDTNPDATIEVIRRSRVDELSTWLIEERKAVLTEREDVTVLGRATIMYSFTLDEIGREGQMVAFGDPLPDGQCAGISFEATSEAWPQVSLMVGEILATVRIAPNDPAPEVPAVGPNPRNGQSGESAWSAPALSWSGPERWYVQPEGQYRIRIPEGWTVSEKMRDQVVDPESDSITDETGEFVLICSRKGSTISNSDRVLTRFVGVKLGRAKCDVSQVSYLAFRDCPSVRIRYMSEETPPVAGSYMAFVHDSSLLTIDTRSPQDAGVQNIAGNIQEILDTLEFIADPPRSLFMGPLGRQLQHFETLDHLTEDFGVTSYDGGVVIHDKVARLDIPIGIDQPGYNVMSGCEAFMESDLQKRELLGTALTSEIIISDYRLTLQIFEGGFLIQDPLQGQIICKVHEKRTIGSAE